MSLNESLSQAMPGLGFVLGGAITALADPRLALAVGAAGSLVFTAAAWIVLSPGRIGPSPGDTPGAPPEPWPERVPTAVGGRETLV
jgi:hypothetical protein